MRERIIRLRQNTQADHNAPPTSTSVPTLFTAIVIIVSAVGFSSACQPSTAKATMSTGDWLTMPMATPETSSMTHSATFCSRGDRTTTSQVPNPSQPTTSVAPNT